MSKLFNFSSIFDIGSRRSRRYRREPISSLFSDAGEVSSEADALNSNGRADVESINDSRGRITRNSSFNDLRFKFSSDRVDRQQLRSSVPAFQSLNRSVDDNNSFEQKNYFDQQANQNSLLKDALASWDEPDQLIAWNQLSLETAAASVVGPTVCARLFSYLNTATYDSWAFFDPKAIGSIYNAGKENNLFKLLKSAGVSSFTVKKFKKIYKSSSGLEKKVIEAGLRKAVIDVSSSQVLSEISSSFFQGEPVPQDLAVKTNNLLKEGLDDLLILGKQTAKLIRDIAFEVGGQISSSINTYALDDRSNQMNFYADTTDYQVSPSVFDSNQPNPMLDKFWQPLGKQEFVTPQWGNVKTFAVNPSELRPENLIGPYLESGDLNQTFIDELNKIVDVSLELTAEQRLTAEFWEGGAGTFTPPGIWIDKTNDLVEDRNLKLEEAIDVLFRVSQALNDAGVVAWDVKRIFNSVRPSTSINQYYFDEQLPDGSLGKDFVSYLPVPAFAEFVSGHSTFSAAAFGVLTNYFRNNIFDFQQTFKDSDSLYSPDGFDGLAGEAEDITLNLKYFSEGSESAGISRIYGAIHFIEGDLEGQKLGTTVSAMVSAKVDRLKNGIDSDEPYILPSQLFGTMDDDIDLITGLSKLEEDQIQEVYGYGGMDTLSAKGDSIVHLYGGSDSDTFKVFDPGITLIRDYVSGEEIYLSEDLLKVGETLSQLEFVSDASAPFTHVFIGDTKLLSLDGNWSSDEVPISMFA